VADGRANRSTHAGLGDDARTMSNVSSSPAIDRALDLFQPLRRPARLQVRDGYLDLLGDLDPTGSHPGQRLMISHALPLIYEQLWRPLAAYMLMGVGHRIRDEHRIAYAMLSLSGGERVLDLACGTGDFTRSFAQAAGDGIVIGLDASRTMLARAVQHTDARNVAYLRADAGALPFRDDSFDAICCFAALYLIERPMQAMDEIARVLAPGGRVALLSSCNRGPLPAAITSPLVKGLTGVRIFDRDELTCGLTARGLVDVRQHVSGLAQFAAARKPAT
jgi:SAM-dependent methyltransferase